MKSIFSGNLNKNILKNPERKGWLLGHFIKSPILLNSTDIEIKWGIHKKGEKYKKAKGNKKAKSLAILVRGRVRIYFPDQNKAVVLSKEGDFLIWSPKIFHLTEFLDDTRMLTIRWPSIANDSQAKQTKAFLKFNV